MSLCGVINLNEHLTHSFRYPGSNSTDYFVSINYVCTREQQRTHLILNGKEHSVLTQKKRELAGDQEEYEKHTVIKSNSHLKKKSELCKSGKASRDSANHHAKTSLEEEQHTQPKDPFICIVLLKIKHNFEDKETFL